MDVLILHLETATKICSVALSKNGVLLHTEELDNDAYVHGEQLTLLIQSVLSKTNHTINEIDAVSVTSGPGSYTGLRIGVSTAKGICYALNVPLIAIDSLQNLHEIARQKYENVTLCPLLDARRMEVYSVIYDSNGQKLKNISADILDETTYSEFDPFIFFGDGSQKMVELWSSRNCIWDADIQISASGHAKLALNKFNKAEFEDVAYFEPNYLKEFVALKKGGIK